MHNHPRSWFPFVLIGLTLILAVGVLLVRSPQQQQAEIISKVSVEDYQGSMKDQLANIFSELAVFESDESTAEFVSEKRDAVLGLMVPPEYRAVHLQIVVALNNMELGYKGDTERLNLGTADLQMILVQTPWLN